MKAYLAKNHSIKFSNIPEIVGNGSVYTRHQVLIAKLCGEEGDDGRSQFEADKLTSLLNNRDLDDSGTQELPEEHQNETEIPALSWDLQLDVGLQLPDTESESLEEEFVIIRGDSERGLLERLLQLSTSHGMTVKLVAQLKTFGCNDDVLLDELVTTEMEITYSTGEYCCKSQPYLWKGICKNNWFKDDVTFYADVTIAVYLLCPNLLSDSSFGLNRNINKRILEDEIASDTTILVKDNVEVKCHRSFLCAQSKVFTTMFKDDYKESQTNTIEMPDITESGARAFLNYIYCNDLFEAEKSSLIALELLKAAEKYDLSSLKELVKGMLLAKPETWYEVDVAMQLYLFSRRLEDGEELKLKTIKLLKVFHDKLRESSTYRQFFKDDSDGAMELCELLFKA